MTKTTTERSSAAGATSAINGVQRRTKLVDEIHAFVHAQRMRRNYMPGWFEDVESKLHEKVMELERELTSEIMAGMTFTRVRSRSKAPRTAAFCVQRRRT